MNDEDSLLFVGTMRLMLLQGSIRLLGVPLSPSTTLHRVFAPRTHPVPVLEVLADHGGTPSENSLKTNPSLHPLLLSLPEYIRKAISATHTVAVVQELSTGVEGLGRIVQSFASVFEPDVREMNFTEEVLKGLYTVS
jgi:polynucleotide 5'-hydroxyl-kinase GRC3/NOL9